MIAFGFHEQLCFRRCILHESEPDVTQPNELALLSQPTSLNTTCEIMGYVLRGKSGFLEVWQLDFLVTRACYVSWSKTLKSWILKKSHVSILSINCYQTHIFHESRNHNCKDIAGHRILRCQILTLRKVWGQHTDAPWDFACARMFSFFLASIFEIGKWILRLGVQRVSGGHIQVVAYACSGDFGAHHRP